MLIAKRMLAETNWRNAILVLLMAALLVPVIIPSGFFFPYVVPRNIFFRAACESGILILVWALCFTDDEFDLRYEPIFWALVAFVGAAVLSALFSPASNHSLFGDFERMGGVWSWMHLALLFLLLRTLRDREWIWVLNAALLVSLFVSFGAGIEHWQLAQVGVVSGKMIGASSSTIGNSGLLAAYLLFGLGMAGYLASTNVRFRLLYLAAGGINLLGLIYAENRSSFIGVVLGAVVGSIIFATLHKKSKRRWVAPAAATTLLAIVIVMLAGIKAFPTSFVTLTAPPVLRRLAATSLEGGDESRTMQWRAAMEGFKDRPLVGYGLDNHDLVWSAHFNPGIYRIDTDVFDKAHNQYLELLATTGLLGALTFLGIWLAIGVTLVRAYRDDRLSAPSLGILAGLQIAYATYLFFWFVDLNSTMLWILFAALIASRENPNGIVRATTQRRATPTRLPPLIALAATVLFCILLYRESYVPAMANRALARVDDSRRSVRDALGEFTLLANTGAHQTAHTPLIMGEYLGSLRNRFAEIRRNPAERRMTEGAFVNATGAFRAEIHRDTLNDRLYTNQAELFLAEASFYSSSTYVDDAIGLLDKAIELSPHRIQARLLLAHVYADDHDYARAQAVLEDATRVDPALGEPRYRLAEVYLRTGKSDSALAMLQSTLRHGYVGAPEVYLVMGKRLEFSGRSGDAAQLYTSYLEAKYSKAVWDGPGTIERVIPSADLAVAAHLPLLYVRSRESELAIKAAAALSAFDSSQTGLVERFVSDVGSRRRSRWVAKNSLLQCSPVAGSATVDPITLGACGVFRKKL
jgi:O-antigen ligase/predicted negative regulator of RcsB-dependent stress response